MIVSVRGAAATHVFDSKNFPILLDMTEEERTLISEMGEQNMVCFFPITCEEDIRKFMAEHAHPKKEDKNFKKKVGEWFQDFTKRHYGIDRKKE